jgi:hypothetical protein
MRVGTKSVLFGAHCFLFHWLVVAEAWRRLYGFPFDPRLWVAFLVHDVGYIGSPNMDGDEGEAHVFTGATISGWLFDSDQWDASWFAKSIGRAIARVFGPRSPDGLSWYCFNFYHSRFIAKRYGANFSMLCVADKLAITLVPWWIYLPMTRATGEIEEYIVRSEQKEGSKYATMNTYRDTQREWYEAMQDYIRRWVKEHKDLREDTWTPKPIA